MTVPNHYFIDHKAVDKYDGTGNKTVVFEKRPAGEEQCGLINDGFYGIANSTKWGVVRWSYCGESANWLKSGRDHTGNDNGAMLIINSMAGLGEEIYTYDPPFELCGEKKYRFQIFAASITGFDAQKAILGLQVWNKTTNTLIDEVNTGEIPIWEGYGSDNPHEVHDDWSEYHIDFTANPGDKLSLKVINNAESGTGNDFVIDDISLYRYDEDVALPDLNISEQAIANQDGASCSYKSSFTIDEAAMYVWRKVEKYVYVLWQTSSDEGLTWTNLTTESGVEKSKLTMEIDGTETAVFRVIVTASATEQEAKEQALYIAQHDAPKNSCSYFTISNTLASIKPAPNCKWKENLKTIWTEDFGVCDTSETKACADAAGTFYTDNGMDFDAGKYIICSMPDSAVKQSMSWNTYPAKEYNECRDKRKGGAMLFAALSKTDTMIYSKAFSGPFCSCKAYMFNFDFYKAENWSNAPLRAQVWEGSNIIGEATAVIGGGEGGWKHITVPFQLPTGFTGSVKLTISQDMSHQYAGNGTMVAIDNLSVTMCGETLPKTSINIDGDEALQMLSGFECEDETKHKINLRGMPEMLKEYPKAKFVWQVSADGGKTWKSLTKSTTSIDYEYDGDMETMYRVVIGESAAVADEVAQSGKPKDGCSVFAITNTVAFKCKESGCREPKFSLSETEEETTLDTTFCEAPTSDIEIKLYQTNRVSVDDFYMETKTGTAWSKAEKTASKPVLTDNYWTLVFPPKSGEYKVYAMNDTCTSDSFYITIEVKEKMVLKAIEDEIFCGDDNYTREVEILSGEPEKVTAKYGATAVETMCTSSQTTATLDFGKKAKSIAPATITVYAEKGDCKSESITYRLDYEDKPSFAFSADKSIVCKGTKVEFTYLSDETEKAVNDYTYLFTSQEDGETEVKIEDFEAKTAFPSKKTTYTLTVVGKYCTEPQTTSAVVDVEFPQAIGLEPVPTISLLTSPSGDNVVCAPATVEFKASGTNLTTWDWEKREKGEEDFTSFEANSTTETKTVEITDETSFRVSSAVTSSNVCDKAYSEIITIKTEKKPVFSLSLDNERVCENGEVTLSMTTTEAYDDTQITATANGNPITLSNGKYKGDINNETVFDVTVSGQVCDTTNRKVTAYVDKPLSFTLSADKTKICEGDNVEFTVTGTSTEATTDIVWYESNDNKSFSEFTMASDLKYSPNETKYVYAGTPSEGACEAFKSEVIEIEVEKAISFDLTKSKNAKICAGTEVEIKIDNLVGTPKSAVWKKEGTELTVSGASHKDTPLATTTYEVTLNGDVCIPVMDNVTVEVESPDGLSIIADKDVICEGESVTLTPDYGTNDKNKVTWWTETEGVRTKVSAMTTDSPTKPTNYYLSIKGDVCEEIYSMPAKVDVDEKIDFEFGWGKDVKSCEGELVHIPVKFKSGNITDYTYSRNGVPENSANKNLELTLAQQAYKENPTEDTEYELLLVGKACPSIFHKQKIIVEKKPQLDFTIDKTGICEGEDVKLSVNATNAERLLWEYSEDGTTFNTDGNYTTDQTRTPSVTTTYRVSTTGKEACKEKSITQRVEVEKSFDVSLDGISEVCPGINNIIEADITGTPQSIVWESSTDGSAYIKAGTGNTLSISPQSTTKYRITLSGKFCEDKTDEVEVKVTDVPMLTLVPTKKHICAGDPLSIETKFSTDAFDESSIVWTETNTKTQEQQEYTSLQAITPEPNATSVYSVSAQTQSGCAINPAQMLITVDEAINAEVGDTTVCEGSRVKLSVKAKGKYKYEWTSDKDGAEILNSSSAYNADATESKLFKIKVTNGYCEKELEANLEVVAKPVIESVDDEGKRDLVVNVTGGNGVYSYDFGDGFQESNTLEEITYGRRYHITVKDETGCLTDTVYQSNLYDIEINPVFTPDGDGENDLWEIKHIEKYPTSTITIYDRRGKVVMKSKGADFDGWDGTYNGHALPSTDYWYEIFIAEIHKKYVGHFTLLRE